MEGPPRYPLKILPKEVWEMIILEVKDSEDLRNLMKASKQLSDVFSNIRHFWWLDKVLPFLMPTTELKCYWNLKHADLANLRLVDKRWRRAVNTFLENQPELRPHNEDDDKVNSEAHIWSARPLEKYDYFKRRGEPVPMGRIFFFDYDQIVKFSEEFKNPETNPFLSRCIIGDTKSLYSWQRRLREFGIRPWNRQLSLDAVDESRWFWDDMVESVFKKFGKHIFFLTMLWRFENNWNQKWDPRLMWKSIVNSLRTLPNLKRLHLNINGIRLLFNPKEFLQLDENQLPPLPFLESLMIRECDFPRFPSSFYYQLMSKYSLQLRKLQMSVSGWDVGQKWTFPNLVELFLENIIMCEEVTKALESLDAPQLAKLELIGEDGDDHVGLNVEDIFNWINIFPVIYLDISCETFIINEGGTFHPQNELSLKYLKTHDSHGVNYNFLRCLRKLERLQISVDEKLVVWDCSAYPEVRIKWELGTSSLYKSNVWELCPKLKTLSVDKGNKLIEFDRITYEKVKNSSEQRKV